MTNFFAVVKDLEEGRSIRFQKWEAITKMFVSNNVLMMQRGEGEPYAYLPSWKEMTTSKWSVL